MLCFELPEMRKNHMVFHRLAGAPFFWKINKYKDVKVKYHKTFALF